MAEIGENYTQALSVVLSGPALESVPAPWFISGTHRANYEAGLLQSTTENTSASTYHGTRVVRLRLRTGVADAVGFGTLDVPVTAKPSHSLPDEPQALNFDQPAAT
jgi:hypothetical protein